MYKVFPDQVETLVIVASGIAFFHRDESQIVNSICESICGAKYEIREDQIDMIRLIAMNIRSTQSRQSEILDKTCDHITILNESNDNKKVIIKSVVDDKIKSYSYKSRIGDIWGSIAKRLR
jgi:hypothetical protein